MVPYSAVLRDARGLTSPFEPVIDSTCQNVLPLPSLGIGPMKAKEKTIYAPDAVRNGDRKSCALTHGHSNLAGYFCYKLFYSLLFPLG